jgi:hypothetical protein
LRRIAGFDRQLTLSFLKVIDREVRKFVFLFQ